MKNKEFQEFLELEKDSVNGFSDLEKYLIFKYEKLWKQNFNKHWLKASAQHVGKRSYGDFDSVKNLHDGMIPNFMNSYNTIIHRLDGIKNVVFMGAYSGISDTEKIRELSSSLSRRETLYIGVDKCVPTAVQFGIPIDILFSGSPNAITEEQKRAYTESFDSKYRTDQLKQYKLSTRSHNNRFPLLLTTPYAQSFFDDISIHTIFVRDLATNAMINRSPKRFTENQFFDEQSIIPLGNTFVTMFEFLMRHLLSTRVENVYIVFSPFCYEQGREPKSVGNGDKTELPKFIIDGKVYVTLASYMAGLKAMFRVMNTIQSIEKSGGLMNVPKVHYEHVEFYKKNGILRQILAINENTKNIY